MRNELEFNFTLSHEISDRKSGNVLLGPSGIVVYESFFIDISTEEMQILGWGKGVEEEEGGYASGLQSRTFFCRGVQINYG